MGDTTRVDDLPGSFGYGAGVLYGLPQPPRWMGEVGPDLRKVLLLMTGGEILYGHLTGLDWEGGNVILRAEGETLSNPLSDLRGILLSGEARLGRTPVAAYRWTFAILACLLFVAVLFYWRVEDVPPSRDAGTP